MTPGILVAAFLALAVLMMQLKELRGESLENGVSQRWIAGLMVPQVLAVIVLAAAGFELLNLGQNYTLLLFIALQYALAAIWEIYRLSTEESPAKSLSRWLWLMQGAVTAVLLSSIL
ncbi:hypothetical protein L2725_18045 [Shewanella corallii]|uniref:DUF4181 domain-containing protein n=1 Tax=Shewanella corallii TaxID=560080 RepID=A0ABT0NB17_9GAMM|nr:hypothetical protein [Shewanella corallii]MCL2915658.1 hypothetical protein [Shewanella corallii]